MRFAAPDGALVAESEVAPGTYAGSGTAGWTPNGAGTTWTYRNKVPSILPSGLGPPSGVVKLILRDQSTASDPERVRIIVKLRRESDVGLLVVAGEEERVDFTVRLGDQGAAEAGLCGESAFVAADCRYLESTKDRRLRCGS